MKVMYQKIKTPLWLILSGLLTSLPLILPELGALQWISVIPMAVILIRCALDSETRLSKLYGLGVLFFGAFYTLAYHWFFYMYPLDFIIMDDEPMPKSVALLIVLIACFGLGLFQAVQTALIFPLFSFISRQETVKRHKIIMPFSAAALWVIFECWQTVGWWGVPWARLPIGQSNAVLLLRSASLFGSYFITFIIVAVNFCLALAICEKKLSKLGTAFAISLFALNLALGSLVTLTYKDEGETVKVAAAQGNISSIEKWGGKTQLILDTYRELTEQAAAEGAEIIVFPETALPYVLFEHENLVEYASDLARDNDITVILSAFTRDEDSKLQYNSIIEVKKDGSFGDTVYSKQRLVPFGEFVPMRELVTFIFPTLANIGMLDDDLLSGDESVVIDSESGRIGSALCFDSIYEKVVLDSVRNGAEIIAVSTNDSWFSDSAALTMHNTQARLRAIESGRYVIRSANTGISSIIDPMGNVKEELGALERGYIVSEVTMRQINTLYSYIGNTFVYLCAAFVILIMLFKVIENSKVKLYKLIKNTEI